jgi:hypothetical protein
LNGRHLEQGCAFCTDSNFNNRANMVVLFLKRFLFFADEADFGVPRFSVHLAKSFSLADARPSCHRVTMHADARRWLSVPQVLVCSVKSCFVFPFEMASALRPVATRDLLRKLKATMAC